MLERRFSGLFASGDGRRAVAAVVARFVNRAVAAQISYHYDARAPPESRERARAWATANGVAAVVPNIVVAWVAAQSACRACSGADEVLQTPLPAAWNPRRVDQSADGGSASPRGHTKDVVATIGAWQRDALSTAAFSGSVAPDARRSPDVAVADEAGPNWWQQIMILLQFARIARLWRGEVGEDDPAPPAAQPVALATAADAVIDAAHRGASPGIFYSHTARADMSLEALAHILAVVVWDAREHMLRRAETLLDAGVLTEVVESAIVGGVLRERAAHAMMMRIFPDLASIYDAPPQGIPIPPSRLARDTLAGGPPRTWRSGAARAPLRTTLSSAILDAGTGRTRTGENHALGGEATHTRARGYSIAVVSDGRAWGSDTESRSTSSERDDDGGGGGGGGGGGQPNDTAAGGTGAARVVFYDPHPTRVELEEATAASNEACAALVARVREMRQRHDSSFRRPNFVRPTTVRPDEDG
jgi:hypothetical protein